VTDQGEPLVKGKRVTGFANTEEQVVHLTNLVPFLVEDELKRLGGIYEKVGDWKSFAITDGHLITGQNPASWPAAAQNRSSYSTDPSIGQQLGGFREHCRISRHRGGRCSCHCRTGRCLNYLGRADSLCPHSQVAFGPQPDTRTLRDTQHANLRTARTAFKPPNAKEFESTARTGNRRALLGT
jgi:hypothetical protein